MKIEQFDCFKARIKYHRTDDLKPDALPDRTEVHVQALWIGEEDEKFKGDWIFSCAEMNLWVPERDLKILRGIDVDEYEKTLKKQE